MLDFDVSKFEMVDFVVLSLRVWDHLCWTVMGYIVPPIQRVALTPK